MDTMADWQTYRQTTTKRADTVFELQKFEPFEFVLYKYEPIKLEPNKFEPITNTNSDA